MKYLVPLRDQKHAHQHFCPGLGCGDEILCLIPSCPYEEIEAGPDLCPACVEEENVLEGNPS